MDITTAEDTAAMPQTKFVVKLLTRADEDREAVDSTCTQCDFSFALEMRFMSHNFWMGERGFLRVFINERLYIMTYY